MATTDPFKVDGPYSKKAPTGAILDYASREVRFTALGRITPYLWIAKSRRLLER